MSQPKIFDADRLNRYRDIVPDWEAFMDALSRPLPLCLWTNTLRTDPRDVQRRLVRENIRTEPLRWVADAFSGPPSDRAGQSLPFVAGLYHIQEEVSLLPVFLLAPMPGERILDLCSAPGNKTARMAVRMRNRGTIVANDWNVMRARATRGILDRLGIVNTTLTASDASRLPDAMGRFDRVLADVPCTCEGTTRKHVDALTRSGVETSMKLHRRQAAILRRGLQLCRPGGLIVYATCTYAPEENEMVVDDALKHFPDEIIVAPARIEGVVSSPGLTEWEGRSFDPSLRRTMRVWPHQNDTGGFFVALLQKRSTAAPPGGAAGLSVDELALDRRDEETWAALLRDRFGISAEALAAFRLHQPNNKYVAAVASDHRTVRAPEPTSVGMPLIRVSLRFPKLTTAGARMLGPLATRNILVADEAQAAAYVNREAFRPSSEQCEGITDTGYVLIEHERAVLGVGLYLEKEKVVKSMFPKVLSRAVST